MTDDVALLGAWKAGDREAGARLFERHYASVLRFFHNKSREQARDLIQRTFLRCLEARDRIEEGSSFRAYLFGIAHNVLLEHFRGVRRDGALFDSMKTSAADVSPQPTPGTLLAKRREVRLLMMALRRIPIELQVILELYYWEHMQAGEIATVMKAPEGTIRTRIRRARQLLVREIEALAESTNDLQSTLSGLDEWAAQLRDELAREGSRG